MNTSTTFTNVCIVLSFLLICHTSFGQKKTNKEIVKAEFKKFPKSIRTDKYFKKAYNFYLQKRHDSTLLYSAKFINSRSSDDKYSNFCHYFRGICFEAKDLFKEAQKEFESLPKSFIMYPTAKMKLGGLLLEQEKFAKALDYFLEIDELIEQNESNLARDLIYHDIGICYLHLNKFEQSEEYMFKSLDLQEKKQDTSLLIGTYMDIASIYYEQYMDEKAIPLFEKGYHLSKLHGDFTLKRDAAMNMAIVEENRKEYLKSIEYRKEYEQWKDSLNDQNKVAEVLQLEKKFISEQKEKEIELLLKDNTIKKAQLNTFIYSSILLLLLTSTLLFFYLSKRKANKLILAQKTELDVLNNTKDRLFSVVSHDLRSNVNALDRSNSEMAELVESSSFERLRPELQHSTELTESIKGLLDNMLNWALLQTQQMYFQQENVSLLAIVNQTAHNYLPLLNSKDIRLRVDIPKSTFTYVDLESIKIVLRNVLDNAIKFSDVNDEISIYSESQSDSQCRLIVEDTGAGISTTNLNKLIEKSLSESKTINQERTGLGLHLCHAMILKNGGKLHIESQENVGTKVIITLPLSQDYE